MKNYVLAFLSLAFITWGCNKDDDDDNNNNNDVQAKVQLVTSAAWKYDTAAIADNNGNPTQALPPGIIEACDKDNILTFKSDSTGVLDEGPLLCAGNPQTTNFNWWFKDNGNVLYTPDNIFGNSNISGDFKVIELTGTRLRVTKEVSTPFGNQNVVLDLKH